MSKSDPAHEYSEVVKSSSIIGGAQIINMASALVRTKVAAILIGPTGVGLLGLFQSIIAISSILAGLGINSSGVRDVAEASGTSDNQRIGRTILTLKRVCWITGLTGWVMVGISARFLSEVTFGSDEYTWHIVLLGSTILMGNVAGGQLAIIQGTRRIKDLALVGIIGGLLTTLVASVLYLAFGLAGIIPALLATSAISLLVSTWFSKSICVEKVILSWKQTLIESKGLVSLGLAFLWSSLLVAIISYLTRMMIANDISIESVGIYSAAFSISGLFVQFVLQAMGADYYPRLTAANACDASMNRMMNQQIEIGLLLAFPGLLATLAFAPWIIQILYTIEFAPASDLLKWFVIGCMGRVISWPLAFAILAKGRGGLFAFVETVFNTLHLLFIWIGIRYIGLEGVSIAFALLYALYSAGNLIVAKRLTGFGCAKQIGQHATWMLPATVLVFCLEFILPYTAAFTSSVIITICSGIYCVRSLASCVGSNHKICRMIYKIPLGHWILISKPTSTGD